MPVIPVAMPPAREVAPADPVAVLPDRDVTPADPVAAPVDVELALAPPALPTQALEDELELGGTIGPTLGS